jgi:hypothetical protein
MKKRRPEKVPASCPTLWVTSNQRSQQSQRPPLAAAGGGRSTSTACRGPREDDAEPWASRRGPMRTPHAGSPRKGAKLRAAEGHQRRPCLLSHRAAGSRKHSGHRPIFPSRSGRTRLRQTRQGSVRPRLPRGRPIQAPPFWSRTGAPEGFPRLLLARPARVSISHVRRRSQGRQSPPSIRARKIDRPHHGQSTRAPVPFPRCLDGIKINPFQ